MKHIMQIFILVQMLTIKKILASEKFKAWANPNFTNRKIIGTAMEKVQQQSKIKCLALCQRKTLCCSFAFNDDTMQCELYDKDFMYSNDVNNVPENSWKYFWVVPFKDHISTSTDCTQYPGSNDSPCSLFCLQYVRYPSSKTIDTAEAECAALNGELVRVDRELKEHCVRMLLASVADGDVFIQGRKINGVWRYDDGTEIIYFNWNTAGGQPSNDADEDHLGIRKSNNYLWHDLRSDFKAFVCDNK